MGLYDEQVLPRCVELACGSKGIDRWRRRATAGLSGTVVEIGFGSGLNVGHYPDDVVEVLAVEPSEVARRRAGRRVARSTVPVRHVGLDGQSLPLEDGSADSALCTFTLCTVPDAMAALAEVRRVVRPGGTFHFLEHGLAPDASVRRWQERIDPLERRLAGGCHLTRDPLVLVAASGMEVVAHEARYVKGPRPWSFFTVGTAVVPG